MSAEVEYTSPPVDELRLKVPKVWAATLRTTFSDKDLVPQSSNPLKSVEEIAQYSDCLRKVTRTLAWQCT